MSWGTFVSFVAAIGVGTIVAAFVGLLVAISNHRQSWINALREDIAEYFRQIELLAYVVRDYLRDSEKFDGQRREARLAVLFLFERIRLRLNRKEDLHIELENKLREFLDKPFLEQLENRSKIDDAIDLSRIILKREWEVVKFPWKPYYDKARKALAGK